MKQFLLALYVLLAVGALYGQTNQSEGSMQQKFASGGTIRLHLSAGGYTIVPSDTESIVVTCHARSSEQLKRLKVAIKPSGSTADVYVEDTPHNHFQATIEVPRRSNLWGRLTAGELKVEAIEGDKDMEILAGQLEIEVPHPEDYGHRDASVTMGAIDASAFDVSKGGMFRSFEQHGPGKYRLHAQVFTGEVDLGSSE